jgi:spermidine synthase
MRIADATQPGSSRDSAALFLISVLGLFLELMLIRWVSTEVRIFAYLQNTVLVVCFLGLGLGCWTCRRPTSAREALFPLFVLVLLLAVPLTRHGLANISQMFSVLQDFPIWEPGAAPDWTSRAAAIAAATFMTVGLLVLLLRAMVPLGRVLGRLFEGNTRPIRAYSVNVAGSLVGIWLFVLASALYLPPVAWCAIAAALALPFLDRRRPLDYALLAGTVALATLPDLLPSPRLREVKPNTTVTADAVRWSPYQKLTLLRFETEADGGVYRSYNLQVNNTTYLQLLDLRPETVERFPTLFEPHLRGLGYYDLPALIQPQPANMLVVGAGGGNDVAGGLRGGAGHIVAVEIDPAIVAFGRSHHPERPYDDPRVSVVTDDARSYFANSSERFDLIVFGLLDAHTTTSMTNARLDHYVYTRESIEQAKRLLTEGGVVVLSFAAVNGAIADRMAVLLRDAFGQEPLLFNVPTTWYGLGGAVFVTGNLRRTQIEQQIEAQPRLARQIARWQEQYPVELPGTTAAATDDWPYVYLERPAIPALFWLIAALMAALYVYAALYLGLPLIPAGRGASLWHFFLLGAAFMLLETQNISKAAVALGNTWDVNAVIISSIMVFILLANAIAARLPRLPLGIAYAGLLASCLGLYFLDLAWFNSLPYTARAVVVGGLTCLPMLFSGIVFVRSFAASPSKDAALGANLLGALVGGLLQSVTFLTGIRALLLIVAALYALAFLTRPRPAD